MNNRTTFALLVLLTAVGTLTVSSAYAQQNPACVGCTQEDAKIMASKALMNAIPVSVWTDKADYGHNDIIKVEGQVANESGYPVTITVISPLNSIVTIDQITVTNHSFETTLNTAGAMWKYDGTYTIKANYGTSEKSNSVKVKITGGDAYGQTPTTDNQCGANELSASGQCMPFSISGGTVTSATLNPGDNGSIVISINAKEDGTLTVTPSKATIDGIFMVLVDGEQWDDVEIVANKVTVKFPAGAETIEIIGTFVIPEFGTIAAMILAAAIISVIAVSAKSKLSIMPRY
jgi:predicted secreted protein with PEFG-CTERM motif